MPTTNAPESRRSSRILMNVNVLVTSLEPSTNFSEVCQTTVVSAHGCAMHSPLQLAAGVPLHFHNQDGREARAQVVSCQPIGAGRHGWMLAAAFDQPENFWGLKSVPNDWTKLPALSNQKPGNGYATRAQQIAAEGPVAASARIVLDKIRQQLSDERLKSLLAELVRPLEAEVAELKNKLAQKKPSSFEVSLAQIPPELEQQIEQRLKQHVGPQVLQYAREQSEQVLVAAKKAIDEKTRQAHDEFMKRVASDFQAAEKRTERLANDAARNLQEHLNRGVGEVHLEVKDASGQLKHIGEEVFSSFNQRLSQEHGLRSQYLEQVQAAAAAESLRLQEVVNNIDARISKLDESACQLESGMDQRLSRMASDTVRTCRSQMEAAMEDALQEFGTRNAQQLSSQMDEAGSNLKAIREGIEASLAEATKARAAAMLNSFERNMEELAELATERWRIAFAGGLNSLVKMLGEQFVLQAQSSDSAIDAKPGSTRK